MNDVNNNPVVKTDEDLKIEEANMLQRPEVKEAVAMAEALRDHCTKHDMMDGIFAGVVVDGDSFAQHYHDTGFQRAVDWLLEAQRLSKEALAAKQPAAPVVDEVITGAVDEDGMAAQDAINAADDGDTEQTH